MLMHLPKHFLVPGCPLAAFAQVFWHCDSNEDKYKDLKDESASSSKNLVFTLSSNKLKGYEAAFQTIHTINTCRTFVERVRDGGRLLPL